MNAIERELTNTIKWTLDDIDYWENHGTSYSDDLRRCTRNLLRTLTACLEYWTLVQQIKDANP